MKFLSALLVIIFAVTVNTGAYAKDYDDAPSPSDQAIGMVTGPKTGTYITFGKDIAREAAKSGVKVDVYDSKGSIDNIKRITSKEKVGLAIVQSDVLGFLSRSHNPQSLTIAHKLRLVAPLYDEEVHILANRDIKSVADLNGKRVVVGSEDSGSTITAENVFNILSITPSNVYETDPPHGVIAVLEGDADAMVFVGGKPVKMFKNMEDLAKITAGPNAGKLDQVHFLSLNDQRLLKEYKPATITHSDYGFVNENVATIAVTAMLITYDYTLKPGEYYRLRCNNMAKLVKALYDYTDDLKASGHPKWNEVDLNADVGDWKRDICTQKVLAEMGVREEDNSALEKDLLSVIKGK